MYCIFIQLVRLTPRRKPVFGVLAEVEEPKLHVDCVQVAVQARSFPPRLGVSDHHRVVVDLRLCHPSLRRDPWLPGGASRRWLHHGARQAGAAVRAAAIRSPRARVNLQPWLRRIVSARWALAVAVVEEPTAQIQAREQCGSSTRA